MRRWLSILALCGVLSLLGCAAITSLGEPFGGTTQNLYRISTGERGHGFFGMPRTPVGAAIDLPFSLVGDVVLFPVSFLVSLSRHRPEPDMPGREGVPPNPWLPKEKPESE
jgi:uncharacterized protein YceK